jgi:ubiquinone/menaquinone biosynthesis C-methylase UbiE
MQATDKIESHGRRRVVDKAGTSEQQWRDPGVEDIAARSSDPSATPTGDHARRDIEFHVGRASTYDDEVTSEFEIYDGVALVPFLDRFVGKGSTFTALDLGCGTGAVTLHLVRRAFSVDAVDHSPDMIAVARERVLEEKAGDPVSFHVCDAAHLPFGDGRFDLVTCQRVLHHIVDMGPVFAEVDRVLKPGGSFYLSDAVADSTPAASALRSLWKVLLPRLGEPQRHGPPRGHSAHRQAAEFKRLLDRQGFSYQLRFFTHVGLQRYLSAKQRAMVIRTLSAPWKKKRGDILFVYARKPSQRLG